MNRDVVCLILLQMAPEDIIFWASRISKLWYSCAHDYQRVWIHVLRANGIDSVENRHGQSVPCLELLWKQILTQRGFISISCRQCHTVIPSGRRRPVFCVEDLNRKSILVVGYTLKGVSAPPRHFHRNSTHLNDLFAGFYLQGFVRASEYHLDSSDEWVWQDWEANKVLNLAEKYEEANSFHYAGKGKKPIKDRGSQVETSLFCNTCHHYLGETIVQLEMDTFLKSEHVEWSCSIPELDFVIQAEINRDYSEHNVKVDEKETRISRYRPLYSH